MKLFAQCWREIENQRPIIWHCKTPGVVGNLLAILSEGSNTISTNVLEFAEQRIAHCAVGSPWKLFGCKWEYWKCFQLDGENIEMRILEVFTVGRWGLNGVPVCTLSHIQPTLNILQIALAEFNVWMGHYPTPTIALSARLFAFLPHLTQTHTPEHVR